MFCMLSSIIFVIFRLFLPLEEEVLLEAFYIEHGYFDEDTNTFGEAYIYWVGILDQDDTLDEYVYLIDTKEVREWPFL